MDSLLSGNSIASSVDAEVNAPATRGKIDGLCCTTTNEPPTVHDRNATDVGSGLFHDWDVNRPVWKQRLLRTDGTVIGWLVAFNIAVEWEDGMGRGEPHFVIKFFDDGDNHELKGSGHDLTNTQFGGWLDLALHTLKPEVNDVWLRWAHDVAIKAAIDDLDRVDVRVHALSEPEICKSWQILHDLRFDPARLTEYYSRRDSYEAGW